MGVYNKGQTAEFWISILNEGIVVKNIDNDVLHSLLKLLADLGILDYCGSEMWTLAGSEGSASREMIKEELLLKFDTQLQEESGFILKYFSRNILPGTDFNFPAMDKGPQQSGNKQKISSNLSNYQIVRKMGRQLSPFIELENNIVSRLEGQHVTRRDAKILFKFMLSKMRTMEKPRQWEQISRKRHK